MMGTERERKGRCTHMPRFNCLSKSNLYLIQYSSQKAAYCAISTTSGFHFVRWLSSCVYPSNVLIFYLYHRKLKGLDHYYEKV